MEDINANTSYSGEMYEPQDPEGLTDKALYVVGIGASAGGLEALESFFRRVPDDSNMAYVVVQHLSPDYKSLMVELLSKHTRLPVQHAADGELLRPNQIYLIPRRHMLKVGGGRFLLEEQTIGAGLQFPIDVFFDSLAEDFGNHAIGIVLSGTGSDGTRGVRSIKEAGGIVMVHEPETAKFDGMPRSAIATGLADFILPVEQMPDALMRYKQHPYVAEASRADPELLSNSAALTRIFNIVRKQTGLDFAAYKPATTIRRLQRRMTVNQLEDVSDYVRLLRESPTEVNAFYKEMLIGVTRFFRDPEMYAAVKSLVIPRILERKSDTDTIRIWISGCSTGEEAYSMAMLFKEAMPQQGPHPDIKIFATDIDEGALATASNGIYPESILSDVEPARLQRFFIRKGDKYQISREIRELVVFARHNVIRDTPFSKIDLVSCRNLLIYLHPDVQRKVLAHFTFSMQSGGFLVLGSSESVGESASQLRTLDSRWKVFEGIDSVPASSIPLPDVDARPMQGGWGGLSMVSSPRRVTTTSEDFDLREVFALILERHLVAAVLIDELGRVVHTFGDVTPFLRVPSGLMDSSLMRMVDLDLRTVLSTALHQAERHGQHVRYPDVRTRSRFGTSSIDLDVEPLSSHRGRKKWFLISFVERSTPIDEPDATSDTFIIEDATRLRIEQLEHDLSYTRESLQATIEELETTNEELQATNEELIASNEELQATNEELHSVNQELLSVNEEYQNKITQLTLLTDDMDNLMSETATGALFLDHRLRIRWFTPGITQFMHLMKEDIGKSIHNVSYHFTPSNLVELVTEVLELHTRVRSEVKTSDGRFYAISVVPYRTESGQVSGVLITSLDITDYRRTQIEWQAADILMKDIINAIPHQIALVNAMGDLVLVNEAWRQFARENGDPDLKRTCEGTNYYEVCGTHPTTPSGVAAAEGLHRVLLGRTDLYEEIYPCHSPVEKRWFKLSIRLLKEYTPTSAIVFHERIPEPEQPLT